jgi:hypothetical protein
MYGIIWCRCFYFSQPSIVRTGRQKGCSALAFDGLLQSEVCGVAKTCTTRRNWSVFSLQALTRMCFIWPACISYGRTSHICALLLPVCVMWQALTRTCFIWPACISYGRTSHICALLLPVCVMWQALTCLCSTWPACAPSGKTPHICALPLPVCVIWQRPSGVSFCVKVLVTYRILTRT